MDIGIDCYPHKSFSIYDTTHLAKKRKSKPNWLTTGWRRNSEISFFKSSSTSPHGPRGLLCAAHSTAAWAVLDTRDDLHLSCSRSSSANLQYRLLLPLPKSCNCWLKYQRTWSQIMNQQEATSYAKRRNPTFLDLAYTAEFYLWWHNQPMSSHVHSLTVKEITSHYIRTSAELGIQWMMDACHCPRPSILWWSSQAYAGKTTASLAAHLGGNKYKNKNSR